MLIDYGAVSVVADLNDNIRIGVFNCLQLSEIVEFGLVIFYTFYNYLPCPSKLVGNYLFQTNAIRSVLNYDSCPIVALIKNNSRYNLPLKLITSASTESPRFPILDSD